MQRFQLIEHTSDTGLIAYGDSLAEAYANAAYGMFSIMADLDRVAEKEAVNISVAGDSPEDLLFTWLNTLLFRFDVDGVLYRSFEVHFGVNCRLEAVCKGEQYDAARHCLKTGVKSATYHMLDVNPEMNLVRVIFDV